MTIRTKKLRTPVSVATKEGRKFVSDSWSAQGGVDHRVWRITPGDGWQSDKYTVTHVPTGYAAGKSFPTIKAAAMACRVFSSGLTRYLETVDRSGVERTDDGFLDFVREHQHGMRRLWEYSRRDADRIYRACR